MAQNCPEIISKLNWWHVRRWHVFGAFRTGPTHAGVNLAEIGNAAWKTSGSQLTLLAAAKDDVTFSSFKMRQFNNTIPLLSW